MEARRRATHLLLRRRRLYKVVGSEVGAHTVERAYHLHSAQGRALRADQFRMESRPEPDRIRQRERHDSDMGCAKRQTTLERQGACRECQYCGLQSGWKISRFIRA